MEYTDRVFPKRDFADEIIYLYSYIQPSDAVKKLFTIFNKH
jgi:hypothetical protein